MMKLRKAFPFIGASVPESKSVALAPSNDEIIGGKLDSLISSVTELTEGLKPDIEAELMAESEREAPILGLDEATLRTGKLSISELVRLAEGAGIEMPDSGGVNVEIVKSLVLTAYALPESQNGQIEFQFPTNSRMGA